MANLLRDTQREGGKGHMKREAKIGVRQPHPKTRSQQKLEEAGKDSCLESLQGARAHLPAPWLQTFGLQNYGRINLSLF